MGQVLKLAPRREPEMDDRTDGELVEATLAGDTSARDRLFRAHYPRVLRLAHRLLGHPDEAEDLAQEVCLAAFRDLSRMHDGQAFAAWIERICVFRARNRIRTYKVLRAFRLRAEAGEWDMALAPSTPPDVAAELRLFYAQLDRVPTELRVVWVLRRIEGMSIPEIAGCTGASQSTVKRRLDAAKARVDRLLASAASENGGGHG